MKLRFAAAALIALLPASDAFAADYVVYGAYTSMEDGGDSFGFGMKLGVPLLTEFVELELRGGYYSDIAEDPLPELEMIPLEAGLTVNALPDHLINPYLAAGAGYNFFEAGVGDVDDSWGAYVGGGFEIGLTDYALLTIEVLYRYIDKIEWSEARTPLSSDNAAANLGLGFRW